MGSTGYLIYDTNTPGVIGPAVINAYTTLCIPAYWRAMDFLTKNLTCFPRSIRREEVAVKHRLLKLLTRRPNTYQNSTLFWGTLYFHWSHYHNAFAWIERDSQFNPIALHNRIPEMVAPFRYLDDDGNPSSWYWIGGMKARVVPAADMLHLHGMSYDGIGGFNPIFILAETFERSRLLDRYVTRYLTRGSMIRGSIEIPAGASKEQQEQIVSTIRTSFQGADAERDVLVLSDGATLKNSTLSPRDSELGKQVELGMKQIAQITGVHPHFLYDDSEGKYNANPEQAADDVVKWTFRPLVEQVEDELSLKLLSESDQDAGLKVHLDTNCLIRGDRETQSNIVTQQKAAGILTPNEARQEIGLPASDHPDADALKTAGDTAAQKPVADPDAAANKN